MNFWMGYTQQEIRQHLFLIQFTISIDIFSYCLAIIQKYLVNIICNYENTNEENIFQHEKYVKLFTDKHS